MKQSNNPWKELLQVFVVHAVLEGVVGLLWIQFDALVLPRVDRISSPQIVTLLGAIVDATVAVLAALIPLSLLKEILVFLWKHHMAGQGKKR